MAANRIVVMDLLWGKSLNKTILLLNNKIKFQIKNTKSKTRNIKYWTKS